VLQNRFAVLACSCDVVNIDTLWFLTQHVKKSTNSHAHVLDTCHLASLRHHMLEADSWRDRLDWPTPRRAVSWLLLSQVSLFASTAVVLHRCYQQCNEKIPNTNKVTCVQKVRQKIFHQMKQVWYQCTMK
jgi:hypothetical protein